MKYKLLCIDLDGTLLDDQKRVLPQVKKCLKDASDRGIRIALASGRMPAGIELVERELGIECIKVCNAGTYILMDGKCIGAEYLSNDVMRDIYRKTAVKNGVPLWIFEGRKWFVTGIDEFVKREEKIIAFQPEVVDAERLAEKWDREQKRPNKLLIAADPQTVPTLYREMKAQAWPDVDMARSAATLIEIFPMGVSKAKALAAICKELALRPEEVIAIGDQELDISMIEAAGVGIAMGNAIPELKEKADFVTKTNNEAGVVYALERYLTE